MKGVVKGLKMGFATIWDFANLIEMPVKMKKIPYLSSPVEIQWEATNMCNHNCYFCYFKHSMHSNNDLLSTDEVKNLVDEADELNTVVLTIGGRAIYEKRPY